MLVLAVKHQQIPEGLRRERRVAQEEVEFTEAAVHVRIHLHLNNGITKTNKNGERVGDAQKLTWYCGSILHLSPSKGQGLIFYDPVHSLKRKGHTKL